MLSAYSRVMLVSDDHKGDGAARGMIGYIIEVYDDGHYEVEFSDSSGTTIAQIVASENELVSSPEPGVDDGKKGGQVGS